MPSLSEEDCAGIIPSQGERPPIVTRLSTSLRSPAVSVRVDLNSAVSPRTSYRKSLRSSPNSNSPETSEGRRMREAPGERTRLSSEASWMAGCGSTRWEDWSSQARRKIGPSDWFRTLISTSLGPRIEQAPAERRRKMDRAQVEALRRSLIAVGFLEVGVSVSAPLTRLRVGFQDRPKIIPSLGSSFFGPEPHQQASVVWAWLLTDISVLPALPLPHVDLTPLRIDVRHLETGGLTHSEPRRIEDEGDGPVLRVSRVKPRSTISSSMRFRSVRSQGGSPDRVFLFTAPSSSGKEGEAMARWGPTYPTAGCTPSTARLRTCTASP